MTQILQPRTSVSLLGGTGTVDNTAQRILVVGQTNKSGVTNGALFENIQIGEEDTLFDDFSMLASMIRQTRRVNQVTRIDAIALKDVAGTASSGSIAISGTATESGSLYFTVGSQRDYTFEVAVASGDTADDVGAALEALIAASSVPASGSNSTGTVTIASLHVGILGNSIGLAYSGEVAGLSVSLTAMSGGAGDPTFTGIFDVVSDNRYQGVIWPYFYNTTEVVSFLDGRFNVDNKVLDGVAFTSGPDTLANHLTALASLNSQSLVRFCDEITDDADFKGPAIMELPWGLATYFAGVRALRLTDGASVGQYVLTANGPLDAFGGPALASKPYFNTPAPFLPLIGTGRGFLDNEIEQLHDAGGSVVGNNSAKTAVVYGEVVTTYKTDSAGNADVTWKYLNYVDTGSNAREYFFNNYKVRFAQSRLTEGDIIPGRDMANGPLIEAYTDSLYGDLAGPDFVLLEDGENAIQFFKLNRSVTLDKALGRATITMTVPIVTQLREILATLRITFSTNS